MHIVTILAHPDDETLGCGGSIAKWSKENKVTCLIPGLGSMSRGTNFSAVTRLRDDCERALATLGASSVYFGDFDDNEMDKYSRLKLFKWVESKLPSDVALIVTHHWRCTNIDHRYCYEAAMVVARPSVDSHIDILCAEIPSSTGHMKPTQFEPTHYEALSDEALQTKIRALSEYSTETAPYPHPRSAESVRALAMVRGVECGHTYAEGFQVARVISGC